MTRYQYLETELIFINYFDLTYNFENNIKTKNIKRLIIIHGLNYE